MNSAQEMFAIMIELSRTTLVSPFPFTRRFNQFYGCFKFELNIGQIMVINLNGMTQGLHSSTSGHP